MKALNRARKVKHACPFCKLYDYVGISLTVDQFYALCRVVPAIKKILK